MAGEPIPFKPFRTRWTHFPRGLNFSRDSSLFCRGLFGRYRSSLVVGYGNLFLLLNFLVFREKFPHISFAERSRYAINAQFDPSAKALCLQSILCSKFAGTLSDLV